jgi:diguanylate cyclase (GGDEF)-like protein
MPVTNTASPSLSRQYAQLFSTLSPTVVASSLYDSSLQPRGTAVDPDLDNWLQSIKWQAAPPYGVPVTRGGDGTSITLAIPLWRSTARLLGVVCLKLAATEGRTQPAVIGETVERLAPALNCLHRELAAEAASQSRAVTLGEQTAQLEWLFNLNDEVRRQPDSEQPLIRLLAAATERLESALGTLIIPERQIELQHAPSEAHAAGLRNILEKMQSHLLTLVTRRPSPLVINGTTSNRRSSSPCKALAIPVTSGSHRVAGMLVFLNPIDAPNYRGRHLFLAKHLGRQVGQLLEAEFDLMTGLLTRSALEQRCDQAMAARPNAKRAVVMIDIDRLHLVNETHGFELGDELIIRVADLLSSSALPGDALVGRLSGDRFAIILEGSEPEQAADIAQTLLAAATKISLGPPSDPLEISITSGVAALVPVPKGFARALAAADIACKAAKDRGRNRVEIYACADTSMMRRHEDVLVVGRLREAIRDERLLIYAQPIVRLDSARTVAGFELLLRMRNRDESISSPGEFLSAAQRYQLLPTIDRYVLRCALQTISPYRGLLLAMQASISINFSAQSLVDESFADYLFDQLRKSAVAPGLLTCEITEQTAISSLAKAADLMKRLRRAGCHIALDDFGTGANTFAYLKGLPVNRIKIDGSFVRDLASNKRSAAMVKAIVDLAKQLELDTVAEYVEDSAILARVESLGVQYGQGYAFGAPKPLEDVLRNLRAEESARIRLRALENW